MAIKIGERHLRAPQNGLKHGGERPVFGQERQQHQARQRRVGGEMREPGGDDRLGRFALNERHAKWSESMRPAGEDRQPETVTAPFDARRKKAEQPARARPRPHQ
jgi:hypothetical protein